MKKLLCLFAVLILLISLCACAQPQEVVDSVQEESVKDSSSESSTPIVEESKETVQALKIVECTGNLGGKGLLNDGQLYTIFDKDILCRNGLGEELWRVYLNGSPLVNGGYYNEDVLFPAEDGIIVLVEKNTAENYYVMLYCYGSDGAERWSTNVSALGEVRGICSDKNGGVFVSINRPRWEGGGIVALHFNGDGKITDIDNIVHEDTGYVDRALRAFDYNATNKCLYAYVHEDSDDTEDAERYMLRINTETGEHINTPLNEGIGKVWVNESAKQVYAVSSSAVYVYDEDLNLLREHSYEYAKNAYALPDGYMIYHSTEAMHEGHKVDIFDISGNTVAQIDLGAAVFELVPFENGFIAATNYLGFGNIMRYTYTGEALDNIEADTDEVEIKIYDFNTILQRETGGPTQPYGKK